MGKGKKTILLIVLISFLILNIPTAALADFEIDLDGALLMEASTGQVLYSKNGEQSVPPASITKIMSLLVILEAIERGDISWDELVTVSENAWRMEGSQMFLEIGQKVTVKDLVKGISIISGNDACVAMAEHLYGSEKAFVDVMNRRARDLGLVSSRFQNSTGWPAENHYMSALDIANLALYLINNHPVILEFESQKEFTFNNIRQYNRNSLIGRYPGADGLKTGWTVEAGNCLVGTAQREGQRMIAVVLNAPDEATRLVAAQKLLDHGFNDFEPLEVAKASEILGEVDILEGKKKTLKVTVAEDFIAFIPVGEKDNLDMVLLGESNLQAPIEKGDVVGRLEIKSSEQVIVSTELVAESKMKRANILVRLFRKIGSLVNFKFW